MKSNDLHHVLIIGGTGMLKGAVNYYLNRNNHLTLIARNEQRLQNLKSNAVYPDKVQILSLDYAQTETAIRKIERKLIKSVPVDAAILWIHSTGNNFKIKLAELLIKMNGSVKIYELLGSADLKSIALQDEEENSNFGKIILGCIKENNSTRWLTHEEICSGTLKAIAENKTVHVVGELPG